MNDKDEHKAMEQGRNNVSKSYGLVCFVAAIGIVLSISLYLVAMSRSIQLMEQDFQHDVSIQTLSLQHKTQVLEQFWHDVQSFYKSSEGITEQEFEIFTHSALKNDAIVFVSWIKFGTVFPAQDGVYLSSRHVEDHTRFKNMVTTSESVRQLIEAAETRVDASASIVSVSVAGDAERDRVIIAVPTFGKSDDPQKHGSLKGYMLILLDVDELFESVFVGDLYGSVAAYLVAEDNKADLLFYKLIDPSVLPYFSSFSEIDVDVEVVRAIPFAGETLAVIAKPAFGYMDVGAGPWLVLLTGLIVTLFTAYWFYQQIGKTIKIQKIVDKKTKELADSEMRIRSIIDYALDAIVTFDQDSRILEWNKQAERIFGWTAEQAVGKNAADIIIAPEYRNIHLRGMDLFVKTGKSKILNKRIETSGVRRDGSVFPMESAVTQQKIGDQHFFTAFIRDMTDKQEAERTRERLAAIVLSSDDAIISKDLDGTITSWNKGAERLYGYKEDEVIGQNIRIIIPPERLKEEESILTSIKSGKTIEHFETERVDKNGNKVEVSVTISPLKDAQGNVIGVSKVARDITERKKVEARLKEYTENLKRSNAELDDFVYIVSHDLKEPIRGLYSYAQFLQEDYGDQLDEEGNQKLDTLKKLATRMEELIDTLLHYSRLGRTELAFKPTNLNKVLTKVMDLVETFAQDRNATIIIQEKLPVVRCDQARVGEIFRNLIVNGIKYNDSEDILIKVGCTENHKDCPGRKVFYVSDNGIGIPEKHRDVVFKMFKRLHDRDAYGGGTGSGLSLVKKIVDRHGGKIWIESEEGKGTTFYFTLERA